MSDISLPAIIVTDPNQRVVLATIAAAAKLSQVKAFIVGGFIRDNLLGRHVCDLDIVVSGDPQNMILVLKNQFNGTSFALDNAAGMFRLTLPSGSAFSQIDITTATGTLEEDLWRRDFSINTMACSLSNFDITTGRCSIIDPTGGLNDLRTKNIRSVTIDVFLEDPARLLRGVRLAAELGFTIEPATEAAITSQAGLVATVAGERTREELVRLLSLKASGATIEYLDKLSLLTYIFPELEPSRGVKQPLEHAWDVLNHQLKTVISLDWVLRRGQWPYATNSTRQLIPWNQTQEEYFSSSIGSGASRLALTRLAAILHDIAKPETRILTESGRIRFFGHAQKGALVVERILERLRFSKREISFVSAIVKAHLRPVQMGPDTTLPTPRAVYRYLRDTGDAAVATLYLSLADHLAARGPSLELDNFREHVTIVDYILKELGRQLKGAGKPRLLNGNELQSYFGLKPGPEMGEILAAVEEAQTTGEINTRNEAIEYVHEILQTREGAR
ncbi:tRNA nucleotidyltransferase [Dehalogenimonas sp. WBC-2]|nr:tRNA nucleotidyltransferase [Dehalogenimonas sp. WBC-2]